ncbi:hypothetical protein R1sor_015854 [Riccia sorocarpa]|uniref:Uncharacterized protein n=1 Tax=Riccia sorocarpa TaxID=122646 RepID=A0ABD3HGT3_9MARC
MSLPASRFPLSPRLGYTVTVLPGLPGMRQLPATRSKVRAAGRFSRVVAGSSDDRHLQAIVLLLARALGDLELAIFTALRVCGVQPYLAQKLQRSKANCREEELR